MLNNLWLWTGAPVFAASLFKLLEALYARRAVTRLADEVGAEVDLGPNPPRLSLIVPACNEEATVEAGVRSMLAQDYPNLEIILVNDRSTDRTGEVMERLASESPGVRVIHIDQLPPGWLGKNHALYTGAAAATGDWLLFADADIRFDPSTFRRAVAFAERERLDHMTLAPEMTGRGFWTQGWVEFFLVAFMSYKSPWKANNHRSREGGIGIGAFNLIRRTAYEQIGTHEAISLRPDDDLRLGQRVKRLGLRQNVRFGNGLMKVEWYPSLQEAFKGLEKNTFAGLEYNLPLALGSIAAIFLIMILPFLALAFAKGTAFWLHLGAVLLQLAMFMATVPARDATKPIRALTYPVLAGLFAWCTIRAMWITLSQGGITWRGTFYPLDLLRSQSGLPDRKGT